MQSLPYNGCIDLIVIYYRYFTWFQEDSTEESMNKIDFPEEYLTIINETISKDACIYKSLLKLWQKDGKKDISRLTKTEILKDITAAMQNK